MHDEPTQAGSEPARSESAVMLMLLEMGHPWPWSMQEITRELGNELLAADAVVGLHAAGLVHRSGEFVFPTRSATRLRELNRVFGLARPASLRCRVGSGALRPFMRS
jgi:hypothetical protein